MFRSVCKYDSAPAFVIMQTITGGTGGHGILLWLLGVPIPVIILPALLWHWIFHRLARYCVCKRQQYLRRARVPACGRLGDTLVSRPFHGVRSSQAPSPWRVGGDDPSCWRLGSGLSLSSAPPWPGSGASVTSFTVMTAIWLIVVHVLLFVALGGYLLTWDACGRTGSVYIHEVFFRDTAHGLLAWAVASVIGIGVLTSAVSSVVSGGVHAMTKRSGRCDRLSASAVRLLNRRLRRLLHRSIVPRSDQRGGCWGQDPRPEAVMYHPRMGMRNGLVPDGYWQSASRQLVAMGGTGISQDDARKRVRMPV